MIPNLQAHHFLLPGAIVAGSVTVAEFAYMTYVWIRNFGPRSKVNEKEMVGTSEQ